MFIRKKLLIILAITIGILILSIYPVYLITKTVFNNHFDKWGTRLVELEKKGLLSREFGAAWQDIVENETMANKAEELLNKDIDKKDSVLIIDGVSTKDYPSLSIVARLNEISAYSNTITITDRKDREIAYIRTDHTRAKVDQLPLVLKTALLAAEDKDFYKNKLGFEFDSFVRAGARAIIKTITTFRKATPRGTSTITQQVAKLFVSQIDESGRRHVSNSIDRKFREMRLASALRKMYSPDEILEVYLNHCIASDYGLIGIKDIANGLFNKKLNELSDAQCVYLARMVKWNRNSPRKIGLQCRIDMERMGPALGWSKNYQNKIFKAIDVLKFTRPKQIRTESGHLVDLANEFWLLYLKQNNKSGTQYGGDMDIINPNSLIRKKGNLRIKLTIDMPLQKYLENLVNNRGFGRDTIIYTDVRIGSLGEDIKTDIRPSDSLRLVTIIDTIIHFSEPNSQFSIPLYQGDTLITNIRYSKKGKKLWRRSQFFYTRRLMNVNGQYFSYCILDSRTGELRAYYSKDKIGSRLACLLKNRVPNGSSTAKPILNALNYDLGNFPPYAKWTDSIAVEEDVPWKRKIIRKDGIPFDVEFVHSAVYGQGYKMHNHDHVFDGCQYLFDHLSTSNNILGVETIYRLNKKIFDPTGAIEKDAFSTVQFLYRINALDRIQKELKMTQVTGVRIYKELSRIIGIDIDSMIAYGKKIAISDSLYSVALGTLEMTLFEQAHLFNMLYNNNLIEDPKNHPGLAIKEIDMNGVRIPVSKKDVIKRYHPFADINNIRPTLLGLHKRLTSNKWDGLNDYDINYNAEYSDPVYTDSLFNREALALLKPLSNFAKSGTTDDIIRPFNSDITSKKRTNYGLWNAVIRIDLSKLSNEQIPEIRDLTIACIGECNDHYTGARDGKTLNKYVSRDLLKKAGVKSPDGFFNLYENYIKKITPPENQFCSDFLPEVIDSGNSVAGDTATDSEDW